MNLVKRLSRCEKQEESLQRGGKQKDRQKRRQKGREAERHNDRTTERQNDRTTERQNDRQTERQKDRKTDRQTDRKTEKQKNKPLSCMHPFKFAIQNLICKGCTFELVFRRMTKGMT